MQWNHLRYLFLLNFLLDWCGKKYLKQFNTRQQQKNVQKIKGYECFRKALYILYIQ